MVITFVFVFSPSQTLVKHAQCRIPFNFLQKKLDEILYANLWMNSFLCQIEIKISLVVYIVYQFYFIFYNESRSKSMNKKNTSTKINI
jgi:hypothetical protein